MMAQMYSKEEFSKDMRLDFKLPADPYQSDDGVDYLRDLGVFFYRDQSHSGGVIIQHDESDGLIEDSGNFLAYYFDVELSSDGTPANWDKPTAKIITKNGDKKAWLIFNKQRVVHSFDHFSIRFS